MERNYLAIIYALITVILWGTVGSVAKLMLATITNFQLMFYVALFSSLSLLVLTLLFGKIRIALKTLKEHTLFVIFLGILGLGLQQFFYFTALAYAPVAQVNVLNYLWPIFILILSALLLQEKYSWKLVTSFILGILGASIVITNGQLIHPQVVYTLGYSLALGAAFCWALFSVISKTRQLEPISSVFLFNLIGLLFMTFIMIITDSSFTISTREIIGTVYIGLFPTAIAFVLWIKALQLGKASQIANLGHLTPFISLFFIFLILREPISLSEILGLVVIISGILLQIKKTNS